MKRSRKQNHIVDVNKMVQHIPTLDEVNIEIALEEISNKRLAKPFIIRAVNAYEKDQETKKELIQMVRMLTAEYVDECEIMLVRQIRDLIAKAEGSCE